MCLGVAVGDGVGDGVAVRLGVGVGVGLGVGVWFGVGVALAVAVGLAVDVADEVGGGGLGIALWEATGEGPPFDGGMVKLLMVVPPRHAASSKAVLATIIKSARIACSF